MISHFEGEFRFLSNFYLVEVMLEGKAYPSVEHAFHAAKTEDSEDRAEIRNAESPGRAKRFGRLVRLRLDWEQLKIAIMTDLVRQKFLNHEELGKKLLATGTQQLVESNMWNDRFWGVCNGYGKNWLGRILMQVRAELRETIEEK